MKRIVWLLLALSLPAWATINGVDSSRVVVPSADGKRYGSHPNGDYDPSPPERVVRYQATFDTVFGGNTNTLNGGFIQTVTTSGVNACTGNATTLLNYTPDSVYMVRREDSETRLGSVITPRKGAGFMFQELDADIDYANSCAAGNDQDKPRTSLSLTQNNFGAVLPVDTIILTGFSFFVPLNIEAENCSSSLAGREMAISDVTSSTALASTSGRVFKFATKTKGDTDPAFAVQFYTEPRDSDSAATPHLVWIGDIADDRGEWIDFVFRERLNPYGNGAITAGTISANASDNSFNDSAGGFFAAGFAVGNLVTSTGFTGNAANNAAGRVITALTASKMTFSGADGDDIVTDAAGESVTLSATQTKVAGITYSHDRGILQVWRTDPSNRSGALKLVYDLATDTAYPVGGGTVTNAGSVPVAQRDQYGVRFDPTKAYFEMDFRLYKHAWGTGRGCVPNGDVGGTSTVTGTYPFGWDEIYIGHEADGTDCTDVTPERADCAAVP